MTRRRALSVIAGLVIAVNLGLLAAAAFDRSWFALAIAAYFGPILNGALMVILLLRTADIRRFTGMSVLGHVVLSIVAPCAAAGLDAWVIFSMELQGC